MLVHTPVNYLLLCGSRDGLLVGCRTCDQKVESLNPGRSGGRSFFSKNQPCVLTLYRCLFRPRYTGVAHKRPRSFCQKCRWHVTPKHIYTLDLVKSEWADNATVQAWCENLSGNELTCHLSGNIWPQLSQLTEPLWADLGIKSGIRVHKLISIKKKKAQA